ncbi:hypothetical protein C8R43DRAFT_954911 [Mycena crocata]|nr:hypothetical protein C8R43DRAFT_954899 [Mycena crocata]KAJ7140175.1 hypothetical protein C8R43DRAFT_954911 [Mycena crocata]
MSPSLIHILTTDSSHPQPLRALEFDTSPPPLFTTTPCRNHDSGWMLLKGTYFLQISSSSASSARIFLRKFPRVASTITHMYTKFYSIFGGPANWDFMSINTTRPPRISIRFCLRRGISNSIFSRRTTRSTPRRILNSIFGTEDGFKYGDLGNSGDGHLPYYPPVGGRRHSDAAISAMFNFGVPTPRATAFSAIPFKCA